MSDLTPRHRPARSYYTAQELSDIFLEWGAHPTITDEDDDIALELERHDQTFHLLLGAKQEFYVDAICRGWVFVESAPHRACDTWNLNPMYGAFSVVYADNGVPIRTDAGFAVRGVRLIEFSRYRTETELITDVLFFWYGLHRLQELVTSGGINLSEMPSDDIAKKFPDWWFGNDSSKK